jgi:hypothetical protein
MMKDKEMKERQHTEFRKRIKRIIVWVKEAVAGQFQKDL